MAASITNTRSCWKNGLPALTNSNLSPSSVSRSLHRAGGGGGLVEDLESQRVS